MSAFKLKIIDRLFITELAKMMAGVMLVLTVILLSQRLVRYLSKVTTGELSADVVLSLVGFNMVLLVIRVLPAALFVSILLVIGRMYRDNEMSSLFSAGIGLSRVYRAVFLFVMPLFVITFYLSTVTMPWALQQIELIKSNDQQSLDIRGISDGRFNEYSRGDLVFYVEKITDDDKMLNVFIQNRQHGKLGITSSKSGEIRIDEKTGDRFIILKNGNRYEGVPGQADYKITKFQEYGVLIAKKSAAKVTFDTKELDTSELMASSHPRAISELQKRLSIPLALITFALLAVPMSKVSPRAGMYGNLLTALLIYIVFENFMSLSHSWLIKGVTPAWVGVWWVHALMVVVALIVLVRSLGFRYVKNQLVGR
ncbi:MAG: LPS export ABC transporter permease LptF [Piscirickettsiaceae bacterium]|nr:MAG: LPS export ABC transporter permease LptF [Piscirickettsiaceae bacterium]